MSRITRLCADWRTYLASRKEARDPDTWVFGEWFGKRCGDSCAYFANYAASRDEKLRLYWIREPGTDTGMLDPRIQLLDRGSPEAEETLRRAGAIFLNQTFEDVAAEPNNRYGSAVTLNFWHGFPWKRIGHDGDKRSGSAVFRLYCRLLDPVMEARYFLTVSDIYSEKLRTAFGVKEEGRLVRAGYPRNAGFYDPAFIARSREAVEEAIRKARGGLRAEGLKIIAYMPTFRDAGDGAADLSIQLADFGEYLEGRNAVIIQKVHFAEPGGSASRADELADKAENILEMPGLNAAVLMAAADVLISDYSSCVFDDLLLDRPIIQYVWDYERYRDRDRGVYFPLEEVRCGRAARDIPELKDAIREALENPGAESALRKARREKLMAYESADSMEKIFCFVKEKAGKLKA